MKSDRQSVRLRRSHAGLGAVVVVLAAAGLAVVLGAFQSSTHAASAPSAAANAIKVHGQWTIQVRRPHGTVVATRRFHNDLVTDGAVTLVKLLARQNSPGWQVRLLGTPSPWGDWTAKFGSRTRTPVRRIRTSSKTS